MKKKINNEDIIIASHNEGKVSEIKDLLKNYDLKILSLCLHKKLNLRTQALQGHE